jgi:peptide/nickel transport system permease protein
VVALDVGALLSGSIVVEQVFQWRGMGTLLLDAVEGSDVAMMQAWLLVSAVVVVLANLVADVLHAWLDPRVREA